jgi:hypothetical protein
MAKEKIVPGELEVGWQPAASRPKLWWFAVLALVSGAIWLIVRFH